LTSLSALELNCWNWSRFLSVILHAISVNNPEIVQNVVTSHINLLASSQSNIAKFYTFLFIIHIIIAYSDSMTWYNNWTTQHTHIGLHTRINTKQNKSGSVRQSVWHWCSSYCRTMPTIWLEETRRASKDHLAENDWGGPTVTEFRGPHGMEEGKGERYLAPGRQYGNALL